MLPLRSLIQSKSLIESFLALQFLLKVIANLVSLEVYCAELYLPGMELCFGENGTVKKSISQDFYE